MTIAANPSAASSAGAWHGLHAASPAVVPASTMWRNTIIVERDDGREESFAIGPDGFIWSYEVAAAGQPAGRLISTGLRGRVFAVGHTAQGALVVIAADEQGVRCVHEARAGHSRWSPAFRVQAPWLAEGVVERIVTITQHGNLFAAFLVRQPDGHGGTRLRMMDAVWSGGTLVVRNEPVDRRGLSFWIDSLTGPLN